MAMTHDELLAKILETGATALQSSALGGGWIYDTKTNALRAVVELHKPQPDHCPCCPPVLCECAEVYPCPTIQAIEKELK